LIVFKLSVMIIIEYIGIGSNLNKLHSFYFLKFRV